MKIKYLAILLIATVFSSCNKLLEENPQGLLVGDVALQDINGLKLFQKYFKYLWTSKREYAIFYLKIILNG